MLTVRRMWEKSRSPTKSAIRPLSVTLHDDGRPFDPDDVPEHTFPPAENDSNDAALGDIMKSLKIGGLGIHFMRELMDDVQFSFNGQQRQHPCLDQEISPKGVENEHILPTNGRKCLGN